MPSPTDAAPADRRRLLLSLGVHNGVAGVLERTGLTRRCRRRACTRCPHGPFAAGGSPYYADLVAHHFEAAGAPIEAGQRCLDFGGSSGRVVRVLKAALPDVGMVRVRSDRGRHRVGAGRTSTA